MGRSSVEHATSQPSTRNIYAVLLVELGVVESVRNGVDAGKLSCDNLEQENVQVVLQHPFVDPHFPLKLPDVERVDALKHKILQLLRQFCLLLLQFSPLCITLTRPPLLWGLPLVLVRGKVLHRERC